MNEHLPYDEQIKQQLADLPLPDENRAWADMKRRLEEDDNDGIIPFWLRGCGLWGLLAVALVGLGWWLFFRKDKQEIKQQETQQLQDSSQQQTGSRKNNAFKKDTAHLLHTKQDEELNTRVPVTGKDISDDTAFIHTAIEKRKQPGKEKDEIPVTATGGTTKKNNKKAILSKGKIGEKKNKSTNVKAKKIIPGKDDISIISEPGSKNKEAAQGRLQTKKETGIIAADTAAVITVITNKTDTAVVVLMDSLKKTGQEQTAQGNLPKKDSVKKKSVSFSAGIAMHQLLPIDGQTFTPYNSQGRKGSLADYIPSVYFRIYKDDKWFLQSEFRYGAPQYTREILYNQKIVQDTQNTIRTTTSAKLKKTFYHQLPVTFNYFLLPRWSLGGGFVWNKFSAAVSEQDVVKRTIATGIDSVISLGVILNNRKADSNFARSYFQAVFETQYKWKQFSLGARYSFGLQPYLKFTLPGGAAQQEKNSSLQLFLRYEIWRSKKEK